MVVVDRICWAKSTQNLKLAGVECTKDAIILDGTIIDRCGAEDAAYWPSSFLSSLPVTHDLHHTFIMFAGPSIRSWTYPTVCRRSPTAIVSRDSTCCQASRQLLYAGDEASPLVRKVGQELSTAPR